MKRILSFLLTVCMILPMLQFLTITGLADGSVSSYSLSDSTVDLGDYFKLKGTAKATNGDCLRAIQVNIQKYDNRGHGFAYTREEFDEDDNVTSYDLNKLGKIYTDKTYTCDGCGKKETFGEGKWYVQINIGVYNGNGLQKDKVLTVEGEKSEISASTSKITFEASGGKKTFTIYADKDYEVSTDDSWIKVSPDSGSSNKTITVTCDANTKTKSRKSQVFIDADDGSYFDIEVVQDAAEEIQNYSMSSFSISSTSVTIGSSVTIKWSESKPGHPDTEQDDVYYYLYIDGERYVTTGNPDYKLKASLVEELGVGKHTLKVVAQAEDNQSAQATGTLTVNAKQLNTYTITYNATGGSGAPASQIKTEGSSITLSTTKPTRSNYIFEGWAIIAGGNVVYNPGDTYIDNRNISLYAVWTKDYCPHYNTTEKPTNTTYSKYDDTYHKVNKSYKVVCTDCDAILTNSAMSTVNEAHIFSGDTCKLCNFKKEQTCNHLETEKLSGNLSYAKYDDTYHKINESYMIICESCGVILENNGTSTTKDTHTFSGNSCKYCGYTKQAKTYTITYNANGGSGAPASQSKSEGKSVTLSSTKPSRSGYTFEGWATSSSGSVKYYPGESYSSDSNLSLYAVWKKAGCPHNNKEELTINTYYEKYDNSRHICYFEYQTICFDCNTTLSTRKDNQKESHKLTNSKCVCGYQQTAKTYTITYNANGGSGAPSSQTKNEGKSITISSTKPTRSGYTFEGWATSSSGSVKYYPGESYSSDSNLSLYAVWTENKKADYSIKSLSANKSSVKLGENITFTIKTGLDCEKVVLYADSYKFATVTSYNKSSSYKTFTYTYQFNSLGASETRTVKAYAVYNGSETNEYDLTSIKVNKAVYELSDFDVYAVTAQIGKSAKLLWEKAKPEKTGTTVKYSVYVDNKLYDEVTTTSYTLSSHEVGLIGTGYYSIMIIATAEGHNSVTSSNNITIEAEEVKTYKIKYKANGGKNAPSDTTFEEGKKATLSFSYPSYTGYKFLGWATYSYATSASYYPGDTVSFNDNTTLYAVWEKIDDSKYTDIKDHWAKDAIEYVTDNNLIEPITSTQFKPNEALSRKALVIALAKLSGVTSDHIQWAKDIELLQGYGNGNYGENDPVNREQLCVFIERYLVLEDYNINALKSNQKNTFADNSVISNWAKDCVYNMQEISIINGRPGNIFDPKAQPTRAEGATVLHKLKLLLDGKTKCKHIYGDKQLVPESEVWIKKDSESHTLVSAQYVKICTICGKEVLYTNNEKITEHHIFDTSGKCIKNGCDAFRFESLIDGEGDIVAGLGDYTAAGTSKAEESEFHIEYSVNGIPVHNTTSNAQVTVQIDDMLIIHSLNGTTDVSPSTDNEYYYGTINDSIFVSPMAKLVMLNKPGVNTIELLTSSSNETLATLTVIVIGDTYDTQLIEKTDYIRNANSQFDRIYNSLNTNEFGAYFSSYMYSVAKLRPDEMLAKELKWITQGDEAYENAIKQTLMTSYSDEDAKKVLSIVELFYNCTAYTEKGLDFFLQSANAMPNDLESVFHTADSWLSLVDISINAQQLKQYTIDQYFTASVMAMNYESNCEVLNKLIKNAADEKTKKVYENVKKDMAAYQRNVITRFLAVTSDTPKGLLCDVYTSAVNSGMTITQTTIPDVFKKLGAGGGYVLAHSITALLADVVFKGEIMYDSLLNIHIANRTLPLLIQDYDSALYNYSLKPNEKNKSTVIATAKILGNYRIWALENCKTHIDSLVIQKLIVPDEIKVDINNIESEKTSIQKAIEGLDTFK